MAERCPWCRQIAVEKLSRYTISAYNLEKKERGTVVSGFSKI